MLNFLRRRRLLVFIAATSIFAALFVKAIPKFLVDTVVQSNEGVGYSAIVAALSEAGAYVDEQTEPGSIDRAQGYRYALRRVAQYADLFFTDHNSATPTPSRCPTLLCKYGFDNPDTVYLAFNPLDGRNSYRLKGRLGAVSYTTYQIFQIGPNGFNGGASKESDQLILEPDGRFEILLAAENPDNHPNFMRLAPEGAGQLVIRQLFKDWNMETETAYEIEALLPDGVTSAPPPVLSTEMFDRRAIGFAMLIKNNMRRYREILADAPVNTLPQSKGQAGVDDGGFPTNFTTQMRYELQPGEAILIEVDATDAVYSNIQLGTLWGESPDYANRTVSYNDGQAHLDSDGVYRYVIAETDPGVPNWLDATGHPQGGVFHRWQSPSGPLPKPQTKVLLLSELRDHLPTDHPVVSQKERSDIRRERLAGYSRRRNPVYISE